MHAGIEAVFLGIRQFQQFRLRTIIREATCRQANPGRSWDSALRVHFIDLQCRRRRKESFDFCAEKIRASSRRLLRGLWIHALHETAR